MPTRESAQGFRRCLGRYGRSDVVVLGLRRIDHVPDLHGGKFVEELASVPSDLLKHA